MGEIASMMSVELAGNRIGYGFPCFTIAEAGVNHNGDVKLARRLVDVAAEARADAVKFQTFVAERVVSPAATRTPNDLDTAKVIESQLKLLKRLQLSRDAHREIHAYCGERKILFLSTPFDEESADLLDELGLPVFKIGSGEITNGPFLKYVAGKHKPIILSTGMATLSEVDEAVRVIRNAGCEQLVLLHCVSSYPAASADANLRAMKTMATAFGVPIGYSDHTPGIAVALAAVALGASVIEKHFTLDKNLPGPDHRTSLEPHELTTMVKSIREVEAALGHGRKEPVASEAETARVARRSLVAARDIPAGTRLTRDLVAVMRPGTGLPAMMLRHVIGRSVRVDVRAGTILELDMLQ